MTRWFRHYAGMARDDKLVRVALRSHQPIERVVWVWSAILENAAEKNDAGLYEIDAAEIAYFLRTDEADIGAITDALASSGHVVASRVVKWGDRQFESDNSATRQARYRAKQKERGPGSAGSGHNESNEVTVPSRHGDGPETETYTEPPKAPQGGRRGRMSTSKVLMGLSDKLKETAK